MSTSSKPRAARWSRVAPSIALALLLTGGCAAQEAPVTWDGRWEGFVETTRQPVLLVLDLDEGPTPTADVTLFGNALDPEELRLTDDSIGFAIQLGPQRIVFSGARQGESLQGGAVATIEGQSDRTDFTFALNRLPTFDEVTTREARWAEDLVHARQRFLAYDRSYSTFARSAANAAFDALEADVGDLDDNEIMVELARITALSDNAHTRMYLLRNRTATRRIPIRLWWFDDGLFVVGAVERWRDTIGCRVNAVGEIETSVVRAQVASLFAGNSSWVDYKSPYFFTAPDVLDGLGIGGNPSTLTLDLDCAAGEQRLQIPAAPLVRLETPTENWRNLSPEWAGEAELIDGEPWQSGLEEAPLFLSRPMQNYWFEPIPGDVLYVQYNRSQNQDGAPSVTEFGESVLERFRRAPTDVIVDLRFNTGGNLGTAEGFFDELLAATTAAGRRIVGIIGEATFSAGLFHAAQLRLGGATLVGRSPGDRLEYWSEGGNIVLPHSGYTLHFANGYHSYSGRPQPDIERVFRSLSVDTLDPDVEVVVRSQDYFAGRDPVLSTALETLRAR